MSKFVNEIEYGLDNFVKEFIPEEEVIVPSDTSSVYYDAIKIYIDEELEDEDDVTLERIIKYIAWRNYDLPIESDSIETDINHHTFSISWWDHCFIVDVDVPIKDHQLEVLYDMYMFFKHFDLALKS